MAPKAEPMKLFDPTRKWPLYLACGLAGAIAALLGGFIVTLIVEHGWDPRMALVAACLLATAPASFAAARLTRGGHNRPASLMLLVVLVAVTVTGSFFSLRAVFPSVVLITLATVTAALWGPVRGFVVPVLAVATCAACLAGAYLPGYLEQRLLQAARDNEIQEVERLLRWGVDPEAGRESGPTPLRFAVENGNPEMVRLLVDRGASPYLGDKRDVSPMQRAIELGQSEIAVLMLGPPAPPRAQKSDPRKRPARA